MLTIGRPFSTSNVKFIFLSPRTSLPIQNLVLDSQCKPPTGCSCVTKFHKTLGTINPTCSYHNDDVGTGEWCYVEGDCAKERSSDVLRGDTHWAFCNCDGKMENFQKLMYFKRASP